ncbi:MAG: SdrD B-like domain-containing protein [Caldilineaceae bacterium]
MKNDIFRYIARTTRWMPALLLTSLLGGLIPPPLVNSMVTGMVPTPMEAMATELVDTVLPAPAAVHAQASSISGTVFIDTIANGTQDGSEGGASNVTVTAYDAAGAQVAQSTTAANGSYTLTGLTSSAAYRLEFTTLPVNYYAGPVGADSHTSVLFVTAPTASADLGLIDSTLLSPCTTSHPDLVVPCFFDGLRTSTAAATTAALKRLTWNGSAYAIASTVATVAQVGTVWGAAVQRSTLDLYNSAYLKRHSDLGPGLGAAPTQAQRLATIYKNGAAWVDLTTAPYSLNFGTVDRTGANALSNPGTDTRDADAFAKIGKAGFGGLDMDPSDNLLWFVNLNTRTVHALGINSDGAPGALTSLGSEPWLGGSPSVTCNNGVARPFAVEATATHVYVGVTCTAENSGARSDLRMYVVEYVKGAGWNTTPVMDSGPLSYGRDSATNRCLLSVTEPTHWNPWWDTGTSRGTSDCGGEFSRPTPLLSEIEFNRNGDMLLGILDRSGDQWGYENVNTTGTNVGDYVSGGDLQLATRSGSTWTIESNPGSNETFKQDNINATSTLHQETFQGGLVWLPADNQVVSTVMDPLGTYSGGIGLWSDTGGNRLSALELFNSLSDIGYLGKANGLGDIEVLCAGEGQPLEIGNRVWQDTDGDGIQDPGEPAIGSVTVTLHDMDNGGTQVGSATTAGDGAYSFGGASDTNMTSGALLTNTNYEVRISLSDGALPVNSVTLQNANGITDNNSFTDLADSDADDTTHAGFATIAFTTGSAGENNHSLDFGFGAASTEGTITIVKNTVGGDGSFGFTSSNATLDDVHLTTVGGTASSAVMTFSAGSYTLREDALVGWSLTGLTCTGDTDGGNVIDLANRQVTIDLDDGEDIVCTFTNTAESSSVSGSGLLTVTKTILGTGSGPLTLPSPVPMAITPPPKSMAAMC